MVKYEYEVMACDTEDKNNIYGKYIGNNRYYAYSMIKLSNPFLKIRFLEINEKLNYVLSNDLLMICYDSITNIVLEFK